MNCTLRLKVLNEVTKHHGREVMPNKISIRARPECLEYIEFVTVFCNSLLDSNDKQMV